MVQDVLKGHYNRTNEPGGSIISHGLFELKISTDRETMEGKCLWLDKFTSQIECSHYKWSKS